MVIHHHFLHQNCLCSWSNLSSRLITYRCSRWTITSPERWCKNPWQVSTSLIRGAFNFDNPKRRNESCENCYPNVRRLMKSAIHKEELFIPHTNSNKTREGCFLKMASQTYSFFTNFIFGTFWRKIFIWAFLTISFDYSVSNFTFIVFTSVTLSQTLIHCFVRIDRGWFWGDNFLSKQKWRSYSWIIKCHFMFLVNWFLT